MPPTEPVKRCEELFGKSFTPYRHEIAGQFEECEGREGLFISPPISRAHVIRGCRKSPSPSSHGSPVDARVANFKGPRKGLGAGIGSFGQLSHTQRAVGPFTAPSFQALAPLADPNRLAACPISTDFAPRRALGNSSPRSPQKARASGGPPRLACHGPGSTRQRERPGAAESARSSLHDAPGRVFRPETTDDAQHAT